MGALIAGLLLAETEYRRQVEVLIEPFKGLFLGVFLISAGMSIDLAKAIDQPALIIGGAVALVAIKAAIIFVLARFFNLNTANRPARGAAAGAGRGVRVRYPAAQRRRHRRRLARHRADHRRADDDRIAAAVDAGRRWSTR